MTASNSALADFGRLSPEQRKALLILLRRRGIDASSVLPIVPVERDHPLPVSYGQQRLWFHARLRPDSSAYHIADAVELSGPLDYGALQTAVDALIRRHESLRTSFEEADGRPVQRIHPEAGLAIEITDLSGEPAPEWPERIARLLDTMASRPFSLEIAPLMRVVLIRLTARRHVLGFCLHHIVADAWSLNLIVSEFAEAYFAAFGGRSARLPTLPVQYADYAVWQHAWLEAGEMQRQLEYWRQHLGSEQPMLELAPGVIAAQADSERGETLAFELPSQQREALGVSCRDADATLFMGLLAVFQALLYRHTGERLIRVGVPHANRARAEVQGVVGFFVNTLILQARVSGALSWLELLAHVRETVLGAHTHADLPFEQLVEALRPERSADRNPLFQVMFNHQLAEAGAVRALESLRMTPYPRAERTTQFELILDTIERLDGSLSATFTYAADWLPQATVTRLAADYQTLLQALVSEPNRRLGAIELLGSAERSQLTEWNRCETGYDGAVRIPDLIARWAERQPEAVAVVGRSVTGTSGEAETRLTYGSLDAASNRLAWQLRDAAVGPETLVALRLPRGVEFLVAVLGVWKAGGAFVPVDPEAPGARVRELLTQAGVRLGLTVAGLPALTADGDNCRWLDLAEGSLVVGLRCANPTYDRAAGPGQAQPAGAGSGGRDRLRDGPRSRADRDVFTACPGARPGTETADGVTVGGTGHGDHPPPMATHPEQLAYLIHTSGSTGTPKGVAVSHGAVSRHVQAAAAAYGLRPEDGALHFAAFSFDAAIEQWAVPLISGAKLVMSSETVWSAEHLQQAVERHRLSYLDLPPAYLTALAESGVKLPGVRCTVGGEALPKPSLDKIVRHLQPAALTNAYGPTEAVITPLTWTADAEAIDHSAYAPIGRPLGERTAWVLDGDLNPLPPGVPGELYIGGPLLARGYHQQPGLTAERFVPDPFGPPGSRLYRTGDRVRQRADGVIDFLGRVDQQLKLRGYRIEPGEIEAVLREQPGVREAAVVLREADSPGARLVGYVAGEGLSPETLQAALRARLEAYRVPSVIVVLDALPRLASGKLDRRSLPAPERVSHAQIAPRTDAEIQLATIWQDVLGIDQVGITDNFFALGGDSILSLQLVSRARAAGFALSPKDVFQHQTLEALAAAAQPVETTPTVEPGPVTGPVPLTPIQAEFFATDIPARHHWNQSVLLASAEPLDVPALGEALRALVQQHDALRLRYRKVDGIWEQAHADPDTCQAEHLLWVRPAADLPTIEAIATEAQRSLDLTHGPLLRALYLPLTIGGSRLLLVIHHLVVDGVSWRILLEDLATAYRQRLADQPIQLPPKTSSFQAWARQLQTYADSQELQAEAAFWNAVSAPALPQDFPGPPGTVADAGSITIAIEPAATNRLLREANAAYRTSVDELLLSALARTLCRWSGRSSALVELEGHGRTDRFDRLDLTRTVGWFTAAFPVRLTPAEEIATSVKAVKEQLRAIPDDGIGYGIVRWLARDGGGAVWDALPRPQLAFNYLGQFGGAGGDSSLLRVATEGRGAEMADRAPLAFGIEVNGQVYGGELAFNWSFSRAQYRTETIARLADAFRSELLAVIAHCVSGVSGLTPSDVPGTGLDQTRLDALPIPASRIEAIYPPTPLQRGLLFHAVYESGSDTYVTQFDVGVEGLHIERFAAAWRAVMDRYGALRTAFLWQPEPPVQLVLRDVELPLVQVDWRDEAVTPERLAEFCAAEQARGFELDQAPLFRLVLIALPEGGHHLIWTCHHLLLDGWSSARVLAEVLQHYRGTALAPPVAAYGDYIRWLAAQDSAASEVFWREAVSPLEAPTRIADTQTVTMPGHGHVLVRSALSSEQTARLQRHAQQHAVTLSTLVQAAWALVLHRHTAQPSVVFGATVSGRPADLPTAEHLVGLFINTLPIVVQFPRDRPVHEWLRDLQQRNLDRDRHAHMPLHDIQRWAGYAGQPLFDSLLVFENYPVDRVLAERDDEELRFGSGRHAEQTNYPLTLVIQSGATLDIVYDFARERFDVAFVEGLQAQMNDLLQALVSEPNRRLGAIELLGSAERSQLTEWNRCETGYDGAVRIPDLIARWAEHRPEAVAVVGQSAAGEPETYLTYRELDVASNRLAWQLRDAAVGPETLVALRLPRGVEFLVAVLGVWKAGGAFVPVDPEAPGARVRELLTQAGVRLGLTVAGLPALTADGDACRWLDLTEPQAWRVGPGASATIDGIGQGDHPLPVATHPEQLAYLIHTSGSTGTPKGVAVSHGTVSRHVQAAAAAYGLSPQDGALHFAAFSFDAAIEQWAVPLISGAKLVLGDPGWTGETTLAVLDRHGLNVVYPPLAPALHLAETLAARGETRRLRRLCVGGEAVARASVATLRTQLQLDCLVNGYGPTETVITPLAWLAAPEHPCDSAYAPIGRPLGERTAWVLDGDLNPLPPGVPGELYIGGPLLARGYHQQPGLTAERFVPDPFGPPGSRLYRTGDRVRQRADGVIDFLGRVDEQLKLRGYRIEPGEIEAVLREQPGVREAIVMLHREGGRAQLLGYVAGENLDPARLKAALAARLPAYMVPSQCLVLPALPRTRHGKVDRAALPLPERISEIRIAPRTEAEIRLAAIWQDVLGIDQVGVTDNFFALGGDSILSLQLVSRARADGLTLSPKDVFRYPTLEALAAVAQPHTAAAAFEEGPVTGPVPLTPIQALFFATAIPARHHWNQALLLAPQQPLDAAHLAQALNDLLARHASLRLRYTERDGVWQQAYAEPERESSEDMLWLRPVADRAALEAGAAAAQRSLDLREGPLLRAVLFTYPDGTQRLLLVVHHLVVDGVSWRILLADLQGAYQVRANGNTCPLPPATSSFKAWSQRLVSWAGRAELQAQRDYWLQQVPDLSPRWPCDDHGGSATNRDAATLTLALDPEQTEALLHTAGAAYRTQIQDLLLTALLRAWRRWSGQTHLAVELEGHGRVPLFPELDLSRSLGWFTSLYPLSLSGPDDLRGAIQAVKEQLRQLPDQGLGYGLLRHLGSPDIQAELAARPRPPLTFNYLGQFDASFGREALFQPAPEDAGADRDPAAPLANELELNGEVYGGQLRFSLTYSAARYRTDTVQPLLDAYREELTALIAHCLSPEAGGLTPSDVPLAGLNQAQLEALPLPHRTLDDLYPLSPLQQGLLFHALESPDSGVYVTQLTVDLDGLDLPRFEATWRSVVARHAILRTGFLWRGDMATPLQFVVRDVELPVRYLDWRSRPVDRAALQDLAEDERRAGFDLEQPPLLRLVFVHLPADRVRLIWTSHHLLLDGWSTSALLGEVVELYAGGAPRPCNAAYRDYIGWLQARDRTADADFWRAQVAKIAEPTRLTATIGRDAPSMGHGLHLLRLDSARTRRLEACAQRVGVTVNTLVQGAWLVLLSRYTGARTVSFGATVAGRPPELPGVESLLGLFINTLPVIGMVDPRRSIGPWLVELQALNLELREHEHTPLFEILRWAGQRELFDALLVFENYPVDRALAATGTALKVGTAEQSDITSYPLTIDVTMGEMLDIGFDYARNCFEQSAIARLAAHFDAVLEGLMGDDMRPLGIVGLPFQAATTPGPRADLAPFAEDAVRIPDLIARWAEHRPDVVGVVGQSAAGEPETYLTYRELDVASNRLAWQLRDAAVGPETLVALRLPRGVEFLVAVLGVWKAGGAFVPVDPEAPGARVRELLTQAGVRLGLTVAGLPALTADGDNCRWLDLAEGSLVVGLRCANPTYDRAAGPGQAQPAGAGSGGRDRLRDGPRSRADRDVFTACPGARPGTATADGATVDGIGQGDHPPPVATHPEQLAYLIHTSGSTGTPKGVAVSHGAVSRHVQAAAAAYGLRPEDGALHFAAFSFDAAIEQWAVPLISGAKLVMSSETVWSAEHLQQAVERHRLSYLDLPPAYLTALAESGVKLPGVRCTVGGEALPKPSLDKIVRHLQPAALTNAYGPTEAVITPLTWTADAEAIDHSAYAPIGRPLGERTAWVLDGDLNPLPPGVPGELYIGGPLLARGYHQQPGLTAERFVPDPFGPPGSRLYRTGDRVRQRADGVIDFLGRVDQQLKLRGYRIEPGEIEAVLREQPGVREAAVVLREADSPGARLVGYVAGEGLSPETLQAALRARLEAYRVPSVIVVLDALPRLASGKLDRRSLPAPERVSHAQIAPRTDAEIQLATIWQDVLGIDQVGITDNFFELGGHSLLALRLVSAINQRLGWSLNMTQMLRQPTISGLIASVLPEHPSLLVALNGAGVDSPPLFCLPPAGGMVFPYLPLARALGGERRVYGLMCPGLFAPDWDVGSLETVATDYVERIRTVQEQGPYHLLGWSLGGALAMEVAHQLEQTGEDVAFLGLLDSYVPGFEDVVDDAAELSPTGGHDPDPDAGALNLSDAERALLGGIDLARATSVMQTLSALAPAYRVKPLRVAPRCWWSEEAGTLRDSVQDSLEAGWRRRARFSTLIATDHEGLVQAPAVLAMVREFLAVGS